METETGDVFGVARSLRVYVTGCKKTQKNRYARLDDHRPEEDRSPSFLLVLVLFLLYLLLFHVLLFLFLFLVLVLVLFSTATGSV